MATDTNGVLRMPKHQNMASGVIAVEILREGVNVMNELLQTKRVLARIAYSDDRLSDSERLVIASGIGGAANFSGDQIETLIKDIAEKPPVESLVAEIKQTESIKQLLIDLSALALVKKGWHTEELLALKAAVDTLNVTSKARDTFLSALELLRDVCSLVDNQQSELAK